MSLCLYSRLEFGVSGKKTSSSNNDKEALSPVKVLSSSYTSSYSSHSKFEGGDSWSFSELEELLYPGFSKPFAFPDLQLDEGREGVEPFAFPNLQHEEGWEGVEDLRLVEELTSPSGSDVELGGDL